MGGAFGGWDFGESLPERRPGIVELTGKPSEEDLQPIAKHSAYARRATQGTREEQGARDSYWAL